MSPVLRLCGEHAGDDVTRAAKGSPDSPRIHFIGPPCDPSPPRLRRGLHLRPPKLSRR